MEYTGKDYVENVRAAAFEDNSPIRADIEDIMHRRCILVHVKIGDKMQVILVKNLSKEHRRKSPTPLPAEFSIEEYTPMLPADEKGKTMKNRVATVDVNLVRSTQLLYNKAYGQFDGLQFMDACGREIAICYFQKPVICDNSSNPNLAVAMEQYLIAGIFTADLDFLSKFFGHQGASSRWLCMLCLAMQSKLEDTFTLAGNAPRFHKRTFESITVDTERYVKDFSSLPTNEQTKEKRTAVR